MAISRVTISLIIRGLNQAHPRDHLNKDQKDPLNNSQDQLRQLRAGKGQHLQLRASLGSPLQQGKHGSSRVEARVVAVARDRGQVKGAQMSHRYRVRAEGEVKEAKAGAEDKCNPQDKQLSSSSSKGLLRGHLWEHGAHLLAVLRHLPVPGDQDKQHLVAPLLVPHLLAAHLLVAHLPVVLDPVAHHPVDLLQLHQTQPLLGQRPKGPQSSQLPELPLLDLRAQIQLKLAHLEMLGAHQVREGHKSLSVEDTWGVTRRRKKQFNGILSSVSFFKSFFLYKYFLCFFLSETSGCPSAFKLCTKS